MPLYGSRLSPPTQHLSLDISQASSWKAFQELVSNAILSIEAVEFVNLSAGQPGGTEYVWLQSFWKTTLA